MREKEPSYTVGGAGTGWATWKVAMESLLQKFKNKTPLMSSPIPLLDIYPKNTETQPKRPMHPCVHCNIICSQDKDSQSICRQWING